MNWGCPEATSCSKMSYYCQTEQSQSGLCKQTALILDKTFLVSKYYEGPDILRASFWKNCKSEGLTLVSHRDVNKAKN